MKEILEQLNLNSQRVWDCDGADAQGEFLKLHKMLKEQVETDCLFLFEAVAALVDNDQISAKGERSKGDTLLKDWLRELRKNAELEDYETLKQRFFEVVGAEQWIDLDLED